MPSFSAGRRLTTPSTFGATWGVLAGFPHSTVLAIDSWSRRRRPGPPGASVDQPRRRPSFFCWQAPTKLRDTDLPPALVYPTQPPPGTLHRLELGGTHVTRHTSLAALLGRTRAEALEATAAGCTTSELALLCGVSVAAASQQATVLREAGLITTRRDGGAVRHEITGLGLSLLNGAGLPV